MNSVVRTKVISAEPVSPAMKNWLKVPTNVTNSDDTDIGDLITEAREQCELITNCALVRSSYVQYLDNFPGLGDRVCSLRKRRRLRLSIDARRLRLQPARALEGRDPEIKRPPLVNVQGLWFIGTDGRPYTMNPGQDFVIDVASQPEEFARFPTLSGR